MARDTTSETIDIVSFYGCILLVAVAAVCSFCSCGVPETPPPPEIKNLHGQTTVILEGSNTRTAFKKWLSENKDKKIVSTTCDCLGNFASVTYEEPPVVVKEIPKCKECGRPYPCEKGEQK